MKITGYFNQVKFMITISIRSNLKHSLPYIALSVLTILALKKYGYDCRGLFCGIEALMTAGKILFAASLFSLVGYTCGSRLINKSYEDGFYIYSILGLVLLVIYSYLRSIIAVPMTQVEVLLLIALIVVTALIHGLRSHGVENVRSEIKTDFLTLIIKLILFVLLISIVTYRETPRVLMLSTDPDVHLYLIDLFQRQGLASTIVQGWGTKFIGYPMGSGVVGGLWSWLSFSTPADTIGYLPMLLSVIAYLALVEFFSLDRQPFLLLTLLVLIVLLSFSGLYIPLLEQYAHQEGTARQLSMPFIVFGIYCGALIYRRCVLPSTELRSDYSNHILGFFLGGAVFVLAVLNPINLFIPFILIAVLWLIDFFRNRNMPRWFWLVALFVPIIILDPYYNGLVFDGVSGSPLATQGSAFKFNGVFETAKIFLQNLLSFDLRDILYIFPYGKEGIYFDFLAPFVLLLVFAFYFSRGYSDRSNKFTLLSFFALFLVGIVFFKTLFLMVSSDPRYFLLYPYFKLSLSQYKIVLLILMACYVIYHLFRSSLNHFFVIVLLIVLGFFVNFVFQQNYNYTNTVRSHYCGSMGCLTDGETRVASEILEYHMSNNNDFGMGRILVPNSIHKMGRESWLFPENVARFLAQGIKVPLAFYYYLGDKAYSTQSYIKKVCEGADIDWLLEHDIRYIVLPEDSNRYCINQELINNSELIMSYESGNPAFLRLRMGQ